MREREREREGEVALNTHVRVRTRTHVHVLLERITSSGLRGKHVRKMYFLIFISL